MYFFLFLLSVFNFVFGSDVKLIKRYRRIVFEFICGVRRCAVIVTLHQRDIATVVDQINALWQPKEVIQIDLETVQQTAKLIPVCFFFFIFFLCCLLHCLSKIILCDFRDGWKQAVPLVDAVQHPTALSESIALANV